MDDDGPIIGGDEETPAQEVLLGRLKVALAASAPGVDAALIEGGTLAEVETSFEALRAALPAVPPHVPAGAPGRFQPGPRTPFEKIREGLARR